MNHAPTKTRYLICQLVLNVHESRLTSCSPGDYKGGGEQPLCFTGGVGGGQTPPPMKP